MIANLSYLPRMLPLLRVSPLSRSPLLSSHDFCSFLHVAFAIAALDRIHSRRRRGRAETEERFILVDRGKEKL